MKARASEGDVAWQRAMLTTLRRVAAEQDVAALARIVEEFLLDHLGDRASCLIHDEEGGVLWSATDDAREVACGEGLIGHVLASGEGLLVPRLDRDRRFRAGSDDPGGDARGSLLVEPVVSGDEVLAVLVVARDRTRAPFGPDDRARLATFARTFAPLLAGLALQVELEQAAEDAPSEDAAPGLYRSEALEAYERWKSHGEVARINSAWLAWTTRALVVLVVLALAYVALVDIGQYATGPALVRLGGRTEVTARVSGSVVEVLVSPGDVVAADQPLVRFYDVEDAAELRRLEQEFELQLRNMLLDPSDETAQHEVASLRAQNQRALAHRQEHLVRAPVAGRVRDVRVRPGQALSSGDVLVSLDGAESEPQVIALLPGDERPRIQPGMTLSFEVEGYPDAATGLIVEQVDDDVVGPAEALRLLGPVADGLQLDGSVILVHARLPSERFESKRARYRWHDGMRGAAEVRVRMTTILEALVPALEEL